MTSCRLQERASNAIALQGISEMKPPSSPSPSASSSGALSPALLGAAAHMQHAVASAAVVPSDGRVEFHFAVQVRHLSLFALFCGAHLAPIFTRYLWQEPAASAHSRKIEMVDACMQTDAVKCGCVQLARSWDQSPNGPVCPTDPSAMVPS